MRGRVCDLYVPVWAYAFVCGHACLCSNSKERVCVCVCVFVCEWMCVCVCVLMWYPFKQEPTSTARRQLCTSRPLPAHASPCSRYLSITLPACLSNNSKPRLAEQAACRLALIYALRHERSNPQESLPVLS